VIILACYYLSVMFIGLVAVGTVVDNDTDAAELMSFIFLAVFWPIAIPIFIGIKIRKLKMT